MEVIQLPGMGISPRKNGDSHPGLHLDTDNMGFVEKRLKMEGY